MYGPSPFGGEIDIMEWVYYLSTFNFTHLNDNLLLQETTSHRHFTGVLDDNDLYDFHTNDGNYRLNLSPTESNIVIISVMNMFSSMCEHPTV